MHDGVPTTCSQLLPRKYLHRGPLKKLFHSDCTVHEAILDACSPDPGTQTGATYGADYLPGAYRSGSIIDHEIWDVHGVWTLDWIIIEKRTVEIAWVLACIVSSTLVYLRYDLVLPIVLLHLELFTTDLPRAILQHRHIRLRVHQPVSAQKRPHNCKLT